MIRIPIRLAAVSALAAAAALPAAAQSAPPLGKYECYSWGRPALTLAFTLLPGGGYADFEGNEGEVDWDPDTQVITFAGASLDGQRTLFKVEGRPTLTFAKPDGSFRLGIACDFVGGG